MNRRRTRLAVIVVGVFVLLVSACSSGDSDSSGTSNSTTGGRIVVADDRAGQDCAADDVGDGEFDEPTYPAPTIPGVEQFTGLTHNHVDGCVDYTQNPPVGGNHREIWQACEFYERAVPPEQAVHSMEHGTVWITYDPSLPASQRATLADFEQDYVLVSPWNRDPLPSPIVASAWGLQLEVDSADDPRLAEFVETYANGPQNTEPGGPCREGGSTETL